MQIPPHSVREAWPKANYINPITRGNENIIINSVFYSLLCCFICIRIFTRVHLKKTFGSDDVYILLAMIPTTAFFVLSILKDTLWLWTRHVYDIPFENITTGLKVVLAAEVSFAAACTLTKLSMLMLVWRMLANGTPLWRRITLGAIIIVALQGTIFCFTVIFQCRPPQDYWKITPNPQPNCISQQDPLLVAGIINTLTDFLVVLLPIRTVWNLQLPRRQVCIIAMLFGAGFTSCFAGAIRTYYMYLVNATYDQTWASFPVWMSSAVELYLGVLCASIPATKPFFTTYIPQIFGALTFNSAGSGYPSAQDPRSPYPNHIITVTTGHGDDLELEKALRIPSHKVSSSSRRTGESLWGGDGDGDDEDYIRVTQTVRQHKS